MKSRKAVIGGGIILAIILYSIIIYCHIGSTPEKLWLPRCNSIEKLCEFHADYPNIEVDIVFRKNGSFDVTHDADTTFNQTIDEYFAYANKNKTRIWLDIKNLTTENAAALHARLDSLCRRYDISRQQLIVEGPSSDALSLFTEDQYYTSYYVPYDKPSRLSEEEIQKCMAHLQTIADSRKVRALSFPGWWYGTIKKHLQSDIGLLTWKHRTTEFELRALPTNWKMLKDPQLKVILVKAKGHFHR